MQKSLKILVVRFSSIGDIVLTSPILRCLKDQINAEVHFITKSSYRDIVEKNPHIDKIHTFNSSLNEVIGDIKNEKFDWIIDLHHNLRSLKLKRLGVKSRSFHKLNIKKFLLTQFKINLLPNIHIVDRYLEAVSHLGVKNDGLGLDFYISNKEKINVEQRFKIVNERYIAFAIGGQHKTKLLTTEKIISICKILASDIVLIGGKGDQLRGDQISKAVGKKVINTCGKFSINESAYIVEKSEYLITHDTGMMHIAAALNKKIVSVWGNTDPVFGMSPYKPNPENKIIEVEGLNCRPCSKIGFDKCPKGHFNCINNIDVNLFINE